jgi:ankyrin repeat protein
MKKSIFCEFGHECGSEYIEFLNHGFDGCKILDIESFEPNNMPRYLSVLHLAVVLRNIKAVQYLIEKGAEVDIRTGMYNRTPLHIAIYRGENQIAEFLIASGADINAIDEGCDGNRTPLDFALETGSDIQHLLIQNGAKSYDELDI